jgi:hypothetical protein
MSINKTPESDFYRFEKFLEAMEDIEFQYWYNHEASDKQKKLANQIREEVSEDEITGEHATQKDAEGVFP